METQMLAGAYAAIGLLFIAATTWLLLLRSVVTRLIRVRNSFYVLHIFVKCEERPEMWNLLRDAVRYRVVRQNAGEFQVTFYSTPIKEGALDEQLDREIVAKAAEHAQEILR